MSSRRSYSCATYQVQPNERIGPDTPASGSGFDIIAPDRMGTTAVRASSAPMSINIGMLQCDPISTLPWAWKSMASSGPYWPCLDEFHPPPVAHCHRFLHSMKNAARTVHKYCLVTTRSPSANEPILREMCGLNRWAWGFGSVRRVGYGGLAPFPSAMRNRFDGRAAERRASQQVLFRDPHWGLTCLFFFGIRTRRSTIGVPEVG
jgi:hypothetical protein